MKKPKSSKTRVKRAAEPTKALAPIASPSFAEQYRGDQDFARERAHFMLIDGQPVFRRGGYLGFDEPITNTEEEVARDPAGLLLQAQTVGPGAAIEMMEARGQKELARSSSTESQRLPTKGCNVECLEKLGFTVGERVRGDELFRQVTFPPGWKVEPTDHSMWNNLLDDKGRKRASIFYKAAFYDREAFMMLLTRYSVQYSREDLDRNRPDKHARSYAVIDTATGEEIHLVPYRDDTSEPWVPREVAQKEACSWLKERFPECDDPLAYWD